MTLIDDGKIEIGFLIPMIGMISAGKSTIINVILNENLLETNDNITTKFVNIIKYNPSLPYPSFTHIIPKKNKNTNTYDFFIDNDYKKIDGKDMKIDTESNEEETKSSIKERTLNKIKEEVEKINKNIRDKESKDEINLQSDLFYLTEVNDIPFTENKNFFLNYCLVDIPGLSETHTIDNNINNVINTNSPKNNEDSFLENVFGIIKNKMKSGIIVLSKDKFQELENYNIIKRLYQAIKSPIINYMIILNKMDISENKVEDINKCKELLENKINDIKNFNFDQNLFIPISSRKLESELYLKNNFYHFLNYYFLHYLDSLKQMQKGENNNNNISMTFIEYLIKCAISPKNLEIKDLIEITDNLNNSANINLIKNCIKDTLSKLRNTYNEHNYSLGITETELDYDKDDYESDDEEITNIKDLSSVSIILIIYNFFKQVNQNQNSQITNNYFPDLTEETIKFKSFFTEEFMVRKFENIIINKENKCFYREIILRMKEVCTEYKEKLSKQPQGQINEILKYLNNLYNSLEFSDKIFIPIIGQSNSGKSTILNGIIGSDILQTKCNPCTKRCFIIKYWNKREIAIRKVVFNKQKDIDNYENINLYNPDNYYATTGYYNVKDKIRRLNGEFINKDDSLFYEISVKINLLDEMNLDENLKNKIYFIDFPGFGEEHGEELEIIYRDIMKISSSFIFVSLGLTLKENSNCNTLKELFNEAKINKRNLASGFIQDCLFVINQKKIQEEEDILNVAKIQIQKMTNINNKNLTNDINICLFNALDYEKFVQSKNYYFNLNYLINCNYKMYWDYYENFYISSFINDSFSCYFSKKLEAFRKERFQVKYKQNDINGYESIEKEITDKINNSKIYFDINDFSKYSKKIAKNIQFARSNINMSLCLQTSNIDAFKQALQKQLIYSEYAKFKQLKEILNIKILTTLDLFFGNRIIHSTEDIVKKKKKNLSII